MPIRGFKNEGIVACFDRTPGVPLPSFGQTFDINHPENAPAKSPADHLDKLTWHSDLFQFEVALETLVTVHHTSLATKTVTLSTNGFSIGGNPGAAVQASVVGDIRVSDILLASHDVSENPIAMVALGGRMLPSGFVVHQSGEGLRQVAPWVNSTGIYLRETAVSGSSDLPAVSLTYSVMLFRHRAPDPSKPLFAGANAIELARGLIDGRRKYAKQVAVGESPFSINLGPTLDGENGRIRSATGGIVITEAGYTGSLAAPPYRNIGL